MSCVIKRPDSKYWIACFTDANGRRLKRSTKVPAMERERRRAEKIAEVFEEAARRKRTVNQVRKVIAGLHAEISGDAVAFLSFRKYLEGWLNTKRAETAPATMDFYSASAKKILDHFGDRADKDISEITTKDLLDYRSKQAERLSAKTVNHSVKFCRMVFKAARLEGLIADDPAERVGTVKRQPGAARKPTFSIDQLRAVMSVADEEWQSMILFGLYTGQRLGDVATLTWANVDLQAGEIRLVQRKTGMRILIPLAGPLKKHIEALPVGDDPDSPLHPRAHGIFFRQGKAGGLSNQFSALLAQAGLRKKQAHRKTHGQGRGVASSSGGLGFHCLRHTANSLLKEAGIPDAVVKALIGHKSDSMSDHYTHVGRESLAKAGEIFPDIL